jgi:hypothetical protein
MDPDFKQQGFMVLTPTVSDLTSPLLQRPGPPSLYRIPIVFIINSPPLTTVGTLSQYGPIVRHLTRSAVRLGTLPESREDRPVSSSLHVVVGLLRTPSSRLLCISRRPSLGSSLRPQSMVTISSIKPTHTHGSCSLPCSTTLTHPRNSTARVSTKKKTDKNKELQWTSRRGSSTEPSLPPKCSMLLRRSKQCQQKVR